mmetsp:Transcript_28598/g.68319  ORF Transcript_28598/g.68319 Transcript_28598/m.68319 type:complete len:265 (-) Transcript_28598:596-1390(-)
MFSFINNIPTAIKLRFEKQINSCKKFGKSVNKNVTKSIKIRKSDTLMTLSKNFDEDCKKIFFTWLIIQPTIALAIPDNKPELKIVDESGNLTKSSISYIEKNLQKVKDLNGNQVYFVSIRSLPFEQSAFGYAKEIFEKWNLTQKDVVVVLVNKIAKAGIYYGGEVQVLTPDTTLSIGEETYTFKAKEEQYSSAAIDVSNRLVSILSNKGDPGPPISNLEDNSSKFKSAKATEQKRSKYVAIIIVLLIIAFVVPMVQFFYYVKDE